MAASGGTSGSGSGAVAGAGGLLWQQPETRRRGPRPALSLPGIAQAGIEIADREGLAAVTMEHVAHALGVTKMALYRYVPGKPDLVALMTDTAIGEAPVLAAIPGGWRAGLEQWASALFACFLRHPWALQATVGARSIGPSEAGWMEQAVGALTGTGLAGGEMLDVTATLAGHVRAMAQQAAASPGGMPERAMTASVTALLHGHEDRFPALAAALSSAVRHDAQDGALDFGLARILDGVTLLIASRAGNQS